MSADRTAALLANFRTRNVGNQALTSVMQSLVVRAYGDQATLRLHRMPHPVTDLVTRRPPQEWSAAAQRLVHLDPRTAEPGPAVHRTAQLPAAGAESAAPGLARRVATWAGHTTPGLWARAVQNRPAARDHLAALLAVDDVIWVPAGEIHTEGVPVGRILDISLAQGAGKRIMLVDLSFEPSPGARPHFERLAPGVHLAVPRDEPSAARFVDVGVPAERVRVVPDAVFLLGSGVLPELRVRRAGRARPRLAVVLHGLTAVDTEPWRRAISLAIERGWEVEVISSHLEQDVVAIRELLAGGLADRVSVAPEITDVQTYLDRLAGFSALLTARFHSAVMGVLAGVVVCALDSYGTKVATGLQAAGLGDLVLTPEGVASGPWIDQFEHRLDHAQPVAVDDVSKLQNRILTSYEELLGDH
jgi:polysaccharide pyruvyl transferase WcaK-like protein